jgi:YidC/Oxa1 family membrane protein insertase
MIEHKNTILAIVLSLIVVVGWNFFIAKPQIERQQREAQLKQQEQTQLQQPQPGGAPATPQTGAPSLPGAPGSVAQPTAPSRDTVVAAAPRIPIQTPTLSGSINLKGARIDNLAL